LDLYADTSHTQKLERKKTLEFKNLIYIMILGPNSENAYYHNRSRRKKNINEHEIYKKNYFVN